MSSRVSQGPVSWAHWAANAQPSEASTPWPLPAPPPAWPVLRPRGVCELPLSSCSSPAPLRGPALLPGPADHPAAAQRRGGPSPPGGSEPAAAPEERPPSIGVSPGARLSFLPFSWPEDPPAGPAGCEGDPRLSRGGPSAQKPDRKIGAPAGNTANTQSRVTIRWFRSRQCGQEASVSGRGRLCLPLLHCQDPAVPVGTGPVLPFAGKIVRPVQLTQGPASEAACQRVRRQFAVPGPASTFPGRKGRDAGKG